MEPIPGPFTVPDIIANFRYEADESGTVSWQIAGHLHQIYEIANVATDELIPGCINGTAACSVAFGPTARTVRPTVRAYMPW